MAVDAQDLRSNGVLADIKVVEFAQNAAVPQVGRLFAGMGADVVKVEPPEGDAVRLLVELIANEGPVFSAINPGKRAITLDLASPDAAVVVERLVKWADVALIGLKAPDIRRYGLSWDRLGALNPALVSLEFTAFGPKGPEADAGGYDMLIQAASGLGFTMNRTVGGVPIPTRPAFIDFASGAIASTAVLGALRHRDRTGQGQRVDASLFGSALTLGTPILSHFEMQAEVVDALREEIDLLRESGASFEDWRGHFESRSSGAGLFRLYIRPYQTSDGLISIAGLSPALIERYHEITGVRRPPTMQRADDPAVHAVVAEAEELFRSRTSDEWLAVFHDAGYPATRFRHTLEAIEQEQAVANDYVVDLHHETLGAYRTVGMPFSYSDTPTGIASASPQLGEHTREVLIETGMDASAIDALIGAGVVTEPLGS